MAVPNKVTVPRNVLPELGDVIHTSRLGQADVAGKAGADTCCWVGAGRTVGRRVGVALTALVASTSSVGVGSRVGVSANIGDVATTADDMAGADGTDVGGVDVGGANVGGVDVGGTDVGGADVGGMDVGGVDVGGMDVGGADVGVTGLVGNMIGVILRSIKTIILPLSPFT